MPTRVIIVMISFHHEIMHAHTMLTRRPAVCVQRHMPGADSLAAVGEPRLPLCAFCRLRSGCERSTSRDADTIVAPNARQVQRAQSALEQQPACSDGERLTPSADAACSSACLERADLRLCSKTRRPSQQGGGMPSRVAPCLIRKHPEIIIHCRMLHGCCVAPLCKR